MKKKAISVVAVAALMVPQAVEANAQAPAHVQRTGERFSSSYGFPTFDWSGYQWAVRQTEGTLNWGDPQAKDPADNRAKWVNGAQVMPNGDLKLRSEGIRGGVEINAVESTGYGTYTFEFSADFNKMDPHNVLGIFPYDMAEMELNEVDEVHKNSHGSTEIDFIEISRWGSVDRALPHGGVTYYPDTERGPESYKISEFDIPAGHQTLLTIAEWEEDYLRVITKTKDGKVLSDVTATERVPRDTGTQQMRINLWTTPANEQEHRNARADEITFHEYTYSPQIGDAESKTSSEKETGASAAPKPDAPEAPKSAAPKPEAENGTVPPAPASEKPKPENGAVPPAPVKDKPAAENGDAPAASAPDKAEGVNGAVPPAPVEDETAAEYGDVPPAWAEKKAAAESGLIPRAQAPEPTREVHPGYSVTFAEDEEEAPEENSSSQVGSSQDSIFLKLFLSLRSLLGL